MAELIHDSDRLLHNARISKSLKARRDKGLPKPGQQVKRLPYPERTLTDYRIESNKTLQEIWAELQKRKEFLESRNMAERVYAPEHYTSIIWTEKNGSEKAKVIRAFAQVLGKTENEIEAALLVPIKYKRGGCKTVKDRWTLAKNQKWKIVFNMDGTICQPTK